MRGLVLGCMVMAACGGGGGPGDGHLTDAATGGNATSINWLVRQSGTPSTCQAVSATEIRLEITAESGQKIYRTLQCVLSPGTVDLAPGRYAIEATIYGPSISSMTAPQQAVTVPTSASIQFIFYL